MRVDKPADIPVAIIEIKKYLAENPADHYAVISYGSRADDAAGLLDPVRMPVFLREPGEPVPQLSGRRKLVIISRNDDHDPAA